MAMTVTGDIEGVQGEGSRASVVGQNVVLSSEPFSVDLSPADGKVGRVSASFEVRLRNLSPDREASLQTSINKDLNDDCLQAFETMAEDLHLVMGDVAYGLRVKKTNLENGADLGEAAIVMKVGQAWVERYGLDNIRIMRRSDAGECQVLPTTFKGYEDGQAVFRAVSPDGLSTFALAALLPVSRAADFWIPLAAGMGSAAVAAGLLIYFILRRRGAREAALLKKWPTGLGRDDWEVR
jgi:hypothetical protein